MRQHVRSLAEAVGLSAVLRLTRFGAFYVTVLPCVVACELFSPPSTVTGHSVVFQRLDGGASELVTRAMSTRSGATITLVGVGRGSIDAHTLPSAEESSAVFRPLGVVHSYTNWPQSGTALYAAWDDGRTASRKVRIATPPEDEVSAAAVVVAGERIADVAWREVLKGNPLTSASVTTTGPATLVAFWWGDAGVRYQKHAIPNNGFRLLGSVLESGALVQCAVAVKRVDAAGTYDVTWRAWPFQGAQLWLVAIE